MVNREGWSICIDCEHYLFGCSWSEELKPVDGWTAIKKGYSMTITDCPQYRKCVVPMKMVSDEGIKNLLTAIVKRTINDYILALSGRRTTINPPEVTKRSIEEWGRSNDAKLLCEDINVPSALANIRAKYLRFCTAALTHWNDTQKEIVFRCPMCGGDAVIKERRKNKQTIKTARCSCGCEYRGNANCI